MSRKMQMHGPRPFVPPNENWEPLLDLLEEVRNLASYVLSAVLKPYKRSNAEITTLGMQLKSS